MRKASKPQWLLFWAAAGLLACGRSHGPSADSNTNWLARCEVESDCDGVSSCICGLCTRICADDAQCMADDSVSASCVVVDAAGDDRACEVTLRGAQKGICRATCDNDDDCSDGTTCVEHTCELPRVETGRPTVVDAGPTLPVDSGPVQLQPDAGDDGPLSIAEPPVTNMVPEVLRDECADGSAQCSVLSGCVDIPDGYRCGDCPQGYDDVNGDGSQCDDIDECEVNNGGCDPLVACTNVPGSRTCGECPEGYVGDGEQGCAPRLLSLSVTPGTIAPVFASDVASYTVDVPPLTRTIGLTVTAAAGAEVIIDGTTVGEDGRWTSPELAFGTTELAISVQRSGQPSSSYTLAIARSGLPQRLATDTGHIAMDGDAMIAGTKVFTRGADGWTMVANLAIPNPGAAAISGDTIAAGSFSQSSNEVYVLTRSASVWTDTAHLQAPTSGSGDSFGYSVAISGDTLVVGAPYEDSAASGVDGDPNSEGAVDSGAAYVFERNGDAWQQTAYLKASNTGAGDGFGGAVVIDGDTIAVSAPLEDSSSPGVNGIETDDSMVDSGAVYVFVRDGATWKQQAYIKASNPGGIDPFSNTGVQFGGGEYLLGPGIALQGETLVVGAAGEDSGTTTINGDQSDTSHTDRGAVYAFTRSNGVWTQQAYIKANRHTTHLGGGVALSGDMLVAGAWQDDGGSIGVTGQPADTIAERSGAAYVFTRHAGSWAQDWILKADEATSDFYFGQSVGTNGTAIAVGPAGPEGTLYLFE